MKDQHDNDGKYIVPITIIIVLIFHFQPENLSVEGFAPFGFTGIQAAISTGGVMFAYLGLHPIVSVAGLNTCKSKRCKSLNG